MCGAARARGGLSGAGARTEARAVLCSLRVSPGQRRLHAGGGLLARPQPTGSGPFDDIWDRLGDGGKAPFFNAPESYQQILADGVQGSPYYRLAKAYVAAELNSVNGAPFSNATSAAFEEATGLFLAARPEQIEPEAVPRFAALAAALEQFNAGAAGPGTCPALPKHSPPLIAASFCKAPRAAMPAR